MKIMGHMHRIIKGIRPSTKVTIKKILNGKIKQELPLELACGNIDRKHYIGLNAIKFDELKGIIPTDLPGSFYIFSAIGNACFSVM